MPCPLHPTKRVCDPEKVILKPPYYYINFILLRLVSVANCHSGLCGFVFVIKYMVRLNSTNQLFKEHALI